MKVYIKTVFCLWGSSKWAQLQSWAPHHSSSGKNICHLGLGNTEYKKWLHR